MCDEKSLLQLSHGPIRPDHAKNGVVSRKPIQYREDTFGAMRTSAVQFSYSLIRPEHSKNGVASHSRLQFNKVTPSVQSHSRFQARLKDQEILEEGGGAGPSNLPRRDHE